MALQPCVACGCFVHEGATACPHCHRPASSLGRKVVHASIAAMIGAATSCVNSPLYGMPVTETGMEATAETGDTGALPGATDAQTTTDTGSP
jgi:hypothetical protein